MKAKLPLMIITVGLIIIAIGLWQMLDSKLQTDASMKKAKEIISENQPNTSLNHHTAVNSKKETNQTIKQVKKTSSGEVLGLLDIPKLKTELPMVEGTTLDDLSKGVGHYKGSYFPGQKGQIVLSGHRETVFRHLGELKIGDTLIVKMPNGNFTYQITHTKIVNSKDTSIITLEHQTEQLILTTCYPFRYIGNAPDRYIIYAKPVGMKTL